MPEAHFSERRVSTFSIDRLIPVMQKAAEFNHIVIEPHIAEDPHFWYLTARSYVTHSERIMQMSEQMAQDMSKSMRKKLAFTNALDESHARFLLEQKASKDPLTGAANRGALDEYLLKLTQHPRPDHFDVVVMLDIDNFKKFNDTYGHSYGDAVLINLVKLLNSSTRGIDLVGRFGGEEFVLVMPERANFESGWQQKCLARIEKIRLKIQNDLAIMTDESSGTVIRDPITASFGVIAIGPGVKSHSMTMEDVNRIVYEEVDHYLYVAKHSGKNRIESPLSDYI